jgi:hypothetical protein
MDWSDQPATQPAHSPPGSPFAAPEPVPPAAAPDPSDGRGRSHLGGPRRTIATALLAVGLLTAGGVAVVFAADPSASPAPSGAAAPSTDGNGATPGTGTTRPQRQGGAGHDGVDCPDKGTGGGGSTSPDGSAAPSTDDPTTAPSPEL